MDTEFLVPLLQESFYLIVVFLFFLFFALKKGRQTVTNIILGLYLALLLSIEFPFYDKLIGGSGVQTESILRLIVFGAFAVLSTMLFSRVLPREYDESAFEGFGSKFLLAAAGTILVMVYSYHALPVTEFIEPGSPINFLFGSENSFFWWLMLPVIILFLV
jgi:hypothetical protein